MAAPRPRPHRSRSRRHRRVDCQVCPRAPCRCSEWPRLVRASRARSRSRMSRSRSKPRRKGRTFRRRLRHRAPGRHRCPSPLRPSRWMMSSPTRTWMARPTCLRRHCPRLDRLAVSALVRARPRPIPTSPLPRHLRRHRVRSPRRRPSACRRCSRSRSACPNSTSRHARRRRRRCTIVRCHPARDRHRQAVTRLRRRRRWREALRSRHSVLRSSPTPPSIRLGSTLCPIASARRVDAMVLRLR